MEILHDQFGELLIELSPSINVEEFLEFDDDVVTAEPIVNIETVG